jgi:uncharacterized membrane protein YccC
VSGGSIATVARPRLRLPHPLGWLDRLNNLLARELAPSPRKLRTALRIATVGTIGAALIIICHVNNEIGTYLVWLLVGAGPMLSARKAIAVLIVEAAALILSVIFARVFAETPWLMLPFLLVVFSLATYVGTIWKLGSLLLLVQVVSLSIYYGVPFAPQAIGWAAAGEFGGTAIALGTIVLFDNWLWPDPGEPLLLEALASSLSRARSRFLSAAAFYLDDTAPQTPIPPPTSDLPALMALLERVVEEGVSEHRHAVLLAAITRITRISLDVDRLTISALQVVPRGIRRIVRPQLEAVVGAIAEVLGEIVQEIPTTIPVGVDLPPPSSRIRARSALAALTARVIEVRPFYLERASTAEIANFGAFNDALATIISYVERLLDGPPPAAERSLQKNVSVEEGSLDPAIVRYSMKVGISIVIGYLIGLVTQRPDLSTIMTTIIITALPTYGGAVRKMILRIVGAVIGGIISLLVIIVVSPNFESLVAYMIALFIVFYLSAYGSLSSGRVAYAGKQIGTTFALVFAGLSPSIDIYAPLWRIWGIMLGTLVVAAVALILWPEYAGDSLLPRMRRVIADALSLIPSQTSAKTEDEIQRINADTMRVLAEILEVADDAQLEGRTSIVDPYAIIEAAGTLRRIANRLAAISVGRILLPMPQLDSETEAARDSIFDALRRQLLSWQAFFVNSDCLRSLVARESASSPSSEEVEKPLEQFAARVEEREYARLTSWSLEQRRTLLAELESIRRLAFLISDLNRWLSRIPGRAAH